MSEYKNIEKEVNGILDKIFSIPFLSNTIIEKLDLLNTTTDEAVIIEFFDGDEGRSARFIRESFTELLNILKDPNLLLYRLLVDTHP